MEEDAQLITDPQEHLDLNFHTDMPVGEILRRTRVHYAQSLQQVEGFLRIRASHLDALEKGDLSQLPGRVYAIGFIRSYSEYLGLDGDKMVHLFKQQNGGKTKKPDLSFPVPASESKIPNMFIIGGSLSGVLVLIGFITFMVMAPAKKNDIPDVPEELTKSQLNQAPSLVSDSTPVPEQQTTTTATNPDGTPVVQANSATGGEAATPAEPAAANKGRIVLEIVDPTWIEIRNKDGAAILRQVLKPGDIYLVPNEQGLIMATGNAGGINVKVDGKSVGALGTAGQIKRKLALDPDLLLKSSAIN